MGGFRRNLSVAEIIAQPLLAMRAGEEIMAPSHIVFMGMGEPLLNLNNVLPAIHLMHDEIGIPMRNITVSTVGITAGIGRLAEANIPVTLAVSLHAPEDALRHRLIPTSTKTSVQDIINAAKNYFNTTGRRVTFEYVLLGGVNDGADHARKLAKLCRGWQCHVNVIPWNDVPDAKLEDVLFHAPTANAVREFKRILEDAGVPITQRIQRGADVAAACGQLRALDEKKQSADIAFV
jgi:23S rRNA (adenine2503-C2)-methyltransferase